MCLVLTITTGHPIVIFNKTEPSPEGFFISAMVRCLLVSKITLALHGEGTLTIVENAEADRLTRMGYCTYQDRSTHAMGNLNAYILSVCLHNYFNHPEFPDSSHVRNDRTTAMRSH